MGVGRNRPSLRCPGGVLQIESCAGAMALGDAIVVVEPGTDCRDLTLSQMKAGQELEAARSRASAESGVGVVSWWVGGAS